MSDENARAREEVIAKYKILGAVQGLFGAGLFTLGVMGAVYLNSDEDGTVGMPYFLGGFTVGSLQLISAFMSGCVVYKGEEGHDTDIKRRRIGCCMHGHYVVGLLCIMLGVMGLVFAGVFGINFNSFDDASEENEKHKKISYALIALLVVVLISVFFTIYLTCSYGKLFGIMLQRQHMTGARVIITADTAAQMNAMNTDSNATALQVEQLRMQNLLLQQQILQQQQQQSQQQSFGGAYPPPPPSYSSVVDPGYQSNSSFPSAPPFGKEA